MVSQVKQTAKRLEFVRGDDVLSAYFNDIKKIRSLKIAEEQALAVRIQSGDKHAIKTLVEANLKFVVAVCRNYKYQGMPMGDLISEGNLGLIRAARRFDGTMNFKFISYAVWWIRQGILTALAEQSRVLNISAGKVGVIHKIGKVGQKLAQTLGRQPCMSEVADKMGMTEKDVDASLFLAMPPKSLSRPAVGDEDGNFEECLFDEDAVRPDQAARRWVVAKNMERMLGPLPDRENQILRLFYGIGIQNTLTLKEIADRFELTRERIRQIKESALRKLRHPSKIREFVALRN